MRPHRQQPTRLRCPWDSPGKNTGVGCHFLLQYMKVKSEREVAQSNCLTTQQSHCWAYTWTKPELKETHVPRCSLHHSLFTIARTWKQPRCPSADKRIRKLWYIYTMEYYLAIKKKKECIWVSSNEVDETGAYYTEWSKSERETPIQYISAYVRNLERQ